MNHVKREKKIEDQTKRGGNLSDNRKKTGEKIRILESTILEGPAVNNSSSRENESKRINSSP